MSHRGIHICLLRTDQDESHALLGHTGSLEWFIELMYLGSGEIDFKWYIALLSVVGKV